MCAQAHQLVKTDLEEQLREAQQGVTDGRVRIAQLEDQLVKVLDQMELWAVLSIEPVADLI